MTYGGARVGSMTGTDKKFTGQQAEGGDDPLGLYNYGARFYSTNLGRFMSADPLVAGAGGLTANPQSLDSFSYVLNNPLRYTDPSGLCVTNPYTGKKDDCDADIAYRYMVCSLSAGHCNKIAYEQQKRGLGGLEGVDLGNVDFKAVSAYSRATLWHYQPTRNEFRQSVRDIDWGSDSAGRSAKLYYDVGLEGLFDTANQGLGLYITLHYKGNTLPTPRDVAEAFADLTPGEVQCIAMGVGTTVACTAAGVAGGPELTAVCEVGIAGTLTDCTLVAIMD